MQHAARIYDAFINYEYTAARPLPVQENKSELTFRAYINLSTQIERVLTITKDTTRGYQGYLTELIPGKKRKGQTTSKGRYIVHRVEPLSGYKNFFAKLDSLRVDTLQNQHDFRFPFDYPFSQYIVEYKKGKLYRQFKFNTYLSARNLNKPQPKPEDLYEQLQQLLLAEFTFKTYFEN